MAALPETAEYGVEAYRCWCAAWTSNPVTGANNFGGGFDSHTLPPLFLSTPDTASGGSVLLDTRWEEDHEHRQT